MMLPSQKLVDQQVDFIVEIEQFLKKLKYFQSAALTGTAQLLIRFSS